MIGCPVAPPSIRYVKAIFWITGFSLGPHVATCSREQLPPRPCGKLLHVISERGKQGKSSRFPLWYGVQNPRRRTRRRTAWKPRKAGRESQHGPPFR